MLPTLSALEGVVFVESEGEIWNENSSKEPLIVWFKVRSYEGAKR